MPMASPFVIQFTEVEQAKLLALLREYTSPYRDVVRAKVVLSGESGSREFQHHNTFRPTTSGRQQVASALSR